MQAAVFQYLGTFTPFVNKTQHFEVQHNHMLVVVIIRFRLAVNITAFPHLGTFKVAAFTTTIADHANNIFASILTLLNEEL